MSDIYETFDYGYDPSVEEEELPRFTPLRPATLPSVAFVNASYLPPVGHQTSPSCFVWSSTYGIATFAAAQAGNYTPSSPNQQASPTYTYIKVLEQRHLPSPTCTGGLSLPA